MTNLAETARLFANAFDRRTRDNGDTFLTLKDGAPDWMRDALYNAHGGMLPDDHFYRMADEAADAIAETLEYDADANLDDWRHECVDAMVSVYHSDRIAAGWYREAESIFEAIRAAIEENADDE